MQGKRHYGFAPPAMPRRGTDAQFDAVKSEASAPTVPSLASLISAVFASGVGRCGGAGLLDRTMLVLNGRDGLDRLVLGLCGWAQ